MKTPSANPQSAIPNGQSAKGPAKRTRELARLLAVDAQRLQELFNRAKVRGGLGAWQQTEPIEMVRQLLHQEARRLGMPALHKLRSPQKHRPAESEPAGGPAPDQQARQIELETQRRQRSLQVPAEPEPEQAALTDQEKLEAERRRQPGNEATSRGT